MASAVLEPLLEYQPRIVGILISRDGNASFQGGNGGILPLLHEPSNPHLEARWETVSDGQFDWGGRLLKCNGGAQRFPQNGWKSFEECKGRRELDCETNKSSRDESRA